jgi:hypothetical protein
MALRPGTALESCTTDNHIRLSIPEKNQAIRSTPLHAAAYLSVDPDIVSQQAAAIRTGASKTH